MASGGVSVPFDPFTFDHTTLPKDVLDSWARSPSLVLDDSAPTSPTTAISAYEYVRILKRREVGRDVLALGKHPFPGLRQARYVPALRKYTPVSKPEQPWMGASMILRYITPQQLLIMGCINLPADVRVSEQFMVDQVMLEQAWTEPDRIQPNFGDITGIHPVFRRKNWLGFSDAHYECLKPSLRLASRFLEIPSVLDLLNAVAKPWRKSPGTRLAESKKGFYQFFTGRTTPLDRQWTAGEFVRMQDFVTFSVDKSGENGNAWAVAYSDLSKVGIRGTQHTTASSLEINEDVIYMLTGGTEFNAAYYNPNADGNASMMRLQFSFAVTLVHELTHAYVFNTTAVSADIEPYCNDQRIAETGMALEASIIEGTLILCNQTNPSLMNSPFGFYSVRWPSHINIPAYNKKASYAKHGIDYRSEYAVPMSFILQFFTDEFWAGRTERFGHGALRHTDRPVGVRTTLPRDPEDYHPLESPRVKRRWNAEFQKMVDDPEDFEPNALHPAVKSGILYPNSAVNLHGAPLNTYTGEKTLGIKFSVKPQNDNCQVS